MHPLPDKLTAGHGLGASLMGMDMPADPGFIPALQVTIVGIIAGNEAQKPPKAGQIGKKGAKDHVKLLPANPDCICWYRFSG